MNKTTRAAPNNASGRGLHMFGLGWLSFYQVYSSLLHTCHGLVSYYRQWMNKFSKMKVHWWTCNHCLLVSCLTSVAFGYGWISDTKFQKFSNKDWIWTFKILIGYGSGVKKSISAHLGYLAPPSHPGQSTTLLWLERSSSKYAKLPTVTPSNNGAVHKWRHTILGKNLPPPLLSHFLSSV